VNDQFVNFKAANPRATDREASNGECADGYGSGGECSQGECTECGGACGTGGDGSGLLSYGGFGSASVMSQEWHRSTSSSSSVRYVFLMRRETEGHG